MPVGIFKNDFQQSISMAVVLLLLLFATFDKSKQKPIPVITNVSIHTKQAVHCITNKHTEINIQWNCGAQFNRKCAENCWKLKSLVFLLSYDAKYIRERTYGNSIKFEVSLCNSTRKFIDLAFDVIQRIKEHLSSHFICYRMAHFFASCATIHNQFFYVNQFTRVNRLNSIYRKRLKRCTFLQCAIFKTEKKPLFWIIKKKTSFHIYNDKEMKNAHETDNMKCSFINVSFLYIYRMVNAWHIPVRWILIKVWSLEGNSMFTFNFRVSCSVVLLFCSHLLRFKRGTFWGEQIQSAVFFSRCLCIVNNINLICNLDCQALTQVR